MIDDGDLYTNDKQTITILFLLIKEYTRYTMYTIVRDTRVSENRDHRWINFPNDDHDERILNVSFRYFRLVKYFMNRR